jgi:hypothetical protein
MRKQCNGDSSSGNSELHLPNATDLVVKSISTRVIIHAASESFGGI